MRKIIVMVALSLALASTAFGQWSRNVMMGSTNQTNSYVFMDRSAIIRSNLLAVTVGDLMGTDTNSTVTGIRGKPIAAPTAGDNGKMIQYNHISGSFTYGTGGSTNDISSWASYPAVAGVNMAGHDITNAGSVCSTNFVATYSGEQLVNSGGTILPYGNVQANNTNSGVITLGNPQITTAGVKEGTVIFLWGAAATSGIRLVNGNGVVLDCGQSFELGSNDFMQFIYRGGLWNEVNRKDR